MTITAIYIFIFILSNVFTKINAFTSPKNPTKIRPELRSSNIKDFEKEEKQFLSKYTLTGSNNAQSNLFEDREDGVSNIMSEAYQKPSESIGAILSCSLLVTGNTVGAGTMVLPDVASGPGMFPSLLVFIGMSLNFNPFLTKHPFRFVCNQRLIRNNNRRSIHTTIRKILGIISIFLQSISRGNV